MGLGGYVIVLFHANYNDRSDNEFLVNGFLNVVNSLNLLDALL